MTQRFGIHRSTETTTANARQPGGHGPGTVAKPADINRFNAALRAKTERQENPESSDHSNDINPHYQLTHIEASAAPLACQQPVPWQMKLHEHGMPTGQSAAQPAGTSAANQPITLALTLPPGQSNGVQQAVAIIHRMISSHSTSKELKTWKIQLCIDGMQEMTVQLEYQGKTDWAVGLLEEHNTGNTRLDDTNDENMAFTEELRTQLQLKNQTLKISPLRLGSPL